MRKLIIAFDVGTTFSGVSYCISEGRGFHTTVQGVNRFPGQAVQGTSSKIPSHLLYLDEEAFRIGEEVDEFERDKSREAANTRALCTKTAWFKLELRPNSLPLTSSDLIRPQFPQGVGPVEVYADFLRYLYDCTKKFIRESEMGGETLLQDESRLRFIITHPNGWEPAQQNDLRTAAKMAGIIPAVDDSRLHLVTEGEAAIHHCVRQGLSREALESNHGIMVIDAGGGTIDISAYRRSPVESDAKGRKTKGLKLEEIVDSQCLMVGSVFVTQRAGEYFKVKLQGSAFESELEVMKQDFDQTAKRLFKPTSTHTYVKCGRASDNVESLRIQNGYMSLTFDEVSSFFTPSLDKILEAVESMKKKALAVAPIKYVFIVGGFSASPWLFERLRDALQPTGMVVTRPDRHVNKAVADGAVAYHLNHYVTTRVAKLTYGTRCYIPYDSENPAHVARKGAIFKDPVDDQPYIDGLFCPIVVKGTQIEERQEFRSEFFRKYQELESPTFENPLRDRIYCYRGDKQLTTDGVTFFDDEPEKYEEIFTLRSTLDRNMLKALNKNAMGRTRSRKYSQLNYEIRFQFGRTELRVQAAMKLAGPDPRKGFYSEYEKRFEPKVIHYYRYGREEDLDEEDDLALA